MAAISLVALLSSGCLGEGETLSSGPVGSPTPSLQALPALEQEPTTTAPPTPTSRPTPPRSTRPALLFAASGGDGDSWKDTAGRAYRLGMVNAPESGECYGGKATAKRKQLVDDGFSAASYTTDSYGRAVSVVTTATGVNVNVFLARNGFADDRYLAEFRSENVELARQLDVAFAAAKRERVGLWGACSAAAPSPAAAAPQAPQALVAPASTCHPDYVTCIPVKGDGSGAGQANDLDCPDIGRKVTLRGGSDPYRLDNDGDGFGCDSS